MTTHPDSAFRSIGEVSDFLDEEFDKVGRDEDGRISDAAVDRYGFMWAVGLLKSRSPKVPEDYVHKVVKAVGWF